MSVCTYQVQHFLASRGTTLNKSGLPHLYVVGNWICCVSEVLYWFRLIPGVMHDSLSSYEWADNQKLSILQCRANQLCTPSTLGTLGTYDSVGPVVVLWLPKWPAIWKGSPPPFSTVKILVTVVGIDVPFLWLFMFDMVNSRCRHTLIPCYILFALICCDVLNLHPPLSTILACIRLLFSFSWEVASRKLQ